MELKEFIEEAKHQENGTEYWLAREIRAVWRICYQRHLKKLR